MKFKPIHTRLASISWVVGFLLLSFASHSLRASELYFIDVHSQVGHKLKNLEQVINRMDKGGVYRIEFQALKGEKRQRFMTGMQNLLKANSAHPFALNHMGQLTPAEVRSLAERLWGIQPKSAGISP